MRLHRLVTFTALGAALLVGRPAAAGTTAFSAGSLIIPMDLCYQPTVGTGGWTSGGSLPGGLPSSYCPDPVATPHDDVLKAYGLVYTMLQNSINVHYVIDPNKATLDGVDLTVTNGAGNAVYLVNNAHAASATLSQARSAFMKAGNTQVQFRGAPFVIDVSNAAAALQVIQNDATSATPQFANVQVYWAMTNFNAPEKGILVGPPPLIALNGLDETNVAILQNYLTDAGLTAQTTTCSHGTCTTSNTIDYWPTIGGAFTVLGYNGLYSDFTTSDALNAGGFKVVWSPHWEGAKSIINGTGMTQANALIHLDAVLAKMAAFSDAGNATFAECIGMGTLEGQASEDSAPDQTGVTHGHFLTNSTASAKGLDANAISNGWPTGAHSGEGFTTDSPTNPIVQIGDYVFTSVNGYTTDMRPNTGLSYVNGVTRLLYTTATNAGDASDKNRDIAIVGNKDGVSTKGLVVYLAGHQYDQGSGLTAGERIPLNTLLFLGQIKTTAELTRSAPIVYTPNGNTYLGTYLQSTQAATGYPPWQGHFREYPGSSLTGANVSAFNTLTANWDAATHVTAQATAGTRNLFTAVSVSGTLTQKAFTTGNAAALGLTAPTITAVTAGGLGGIDHSIPAIIGPSAVAGLPSRPVIAYVGALDGMVHAFLISGSLTYNAHSYSAGDEVWAFIPPSQLTNTVAYSGGVDGSPSVGDAFVDTGSGTRSWHTLLAIPDGHFTGGTFDVLDITDPSNPKFLWEASDSITTGGKTYVLGRAQGLAISPVTIGGNVKYAYFVATDNTNSSGGNASGGNAFNLFALEAGKGTVLWRYNHAYVNNTTNNDVPGTVAVIDDKGDNGPATKLFFGDLEGKVWSINATDGTSATAFYDAATANGHANSLNYPIESGVVLYRDPTNSHLDLLGVTGGADWVPSSVSSYVFKVDTTTSTGTNLYTTAAGERVYAVPTIYGNSAYLITSQGNLGQQSATGTDFSQTGGNLIRVNLGSAGGSTVLANVKAGASEVAVDANGNVVAASAAGLTMNGNVGRDTSQAVIALQNASAKALTVRAWLDLH